MVSTGNMMLECKKMNGVPEITAGVRHVAVNRLQSEQTNERQPKPYVNAFVVAFPSLCAC